MEKIVIQAYCENFKIRSETVGTKIVLVTSTSTRFIIELSCACEHVIYFLMPEAVRLFAHPEWIGNRIRIIAKKHFPVF